MEGSNLKTFAKLNFEFLRLIFRGKQGIVLKNLALRQQLTVQQRSIKRPKIKNAECSCQAIMGHPKKQPFLTENKDLQFGATFKIISKLCICQA